MFYLTMLSVAKII